MRSRPSSERSSTTTTSGSTGSSARTWSRSRCRANRRVPRRDARTAQGQVRRGHHRLGRPAPTRPRTCRTPRSDPRANTIPGTEDELDESMLLAPMTFEDQVLGVLVLSKLGLHQFSDDDLRLLVIYASFAAQAFANADATDRLRAQSEALERQLGQPASACSRSPSQSSRRSTRRAILDQVADRLVGPRRVRQHRDRDRSTLSSGLLPPIDGARHPRRRVHGALGARRRRARDLGRRPQRARPRPRRAPRPADQPLPRLVDGRQPDLRPASWPRGCHRRPHPRAPRRRPALHRGRVRTGEALRGPGIDRPPERRGPPRRRDPRSNRRPDRTAQPRDVPGLPEAERGEPRDLQPDHARPRRLQGRQRRPRPPGRRPAAGRYRRGDRRRRPGERPRLPLRWR